VKAYLHHNEHPLQKLLRKDRETLKPYWEVPDMLMDLMPDEYTVPFEKYQNADPTEKKFLRLTPNVKVMLTLIDVVRTGMRMSESDTIGAALRNWEYSTSAEGPSEIGDLIGQLSTGFIDELLTDMGVAVQAPAPTGLPAPAATPIQMPEPAGALPTR